VAKFNVGEAFLQVVASVENIHKTIAAEVAKIKDIQIDVTPNMEGFREKVAAATADLADVDVNVKPDTTGFREKVRTVAAGIDPVTVPVDADVTPARRDLAALKTEVARLQDTKLQIGADTAQARVELNGLQDELRKLREQPTSAEVDAQIAGAEAKIAELKTQLSTLKETRLQVDADTAAARVKIAALSAEVARESPKVSPELDTTRANAQIGRFATEMRAKLEAATKALGDIHMTADASDVDREIARVRIQLASLANQRIGVDVDAATATAKIAELKAKLDELGAKSPNIQVKVDVAKATAELAAFRAVVAGVDNDGNAVSKAFGAIATAVGSGISALGSFVGSASQVGSTLTSMGSSVTGASTSFASFGQSIGSALSSVAPFLATAAQWTALGVAIAAAGSVAVGALGQIGGAAVALGSGIVPLTESLGLLPGLLAPLGIGLGTLAIGFSNAGKNGIEFKNTMDQLKSAFDPVINSIRSQMQPAIQTFLNSIKGLAPVIQQMVPQITAAVSQVTNSFSQLFSSSSFKNDLQTLLAGAAQNIKTFGDAAKNAFQGFMNILVAAQPAVNRIATDIDQAAQKFNAWTAAARQSGELTTMFQQAATVLEQLGTTLTNVAQLFVALWNSANRTGAFTSTLTAINNGITQFTNYVNQAGGAWDQLMSKAGSVTQSLVGLVGSIGNAFVTLGSQIDISSTIDTITQAINNMTPAFAQIGQAATPVFNNLIEIIGRMVQALGPQVSQSITQFGDAIKAIDWEAVTQGIAGFIKGMSDIVSTISTVGQSFTTFEQLINQVSSGDFAGAAQSLQHLDDLWTKLGDTLTDTSGLDAARDSVQGLNATIQGVPPTHDTKFNADGSPLQGTASQAQGWIEGVSSDWDTKFNGDASGVQSAAQQATAAATGVAQTMTTLFLGDAGALIGVAATATGNVTQVPTNHPTTFTGDASGAVGAAQQATTATQGVQDKNVNITGDASAFTNAVTEANNSLNTLQDRLIKITGDNAVLVQAAQDSVTQLNAIVDKNIKINADNSQALQAIQQVQQALDSLQDKTVTVTTNYVTTGTPPGQAAGGIVQRMAGGGSLTPMSGQSARIVPPNTWRVIGDRMRGDEAFIPINQSPRSMAILGTTANRMGFRLAPMHSGGFASGDGRAWDWLEELLRRSRHGHGRPTPPPPQQLLQTVGQANVQGFGVGSSVGLSGSALPITPAMLSTLHQVTPAVPTPPSTGSGSGGGRRGGEDEVRIRGDGPLFEAFMRMVRSEVRKRGSKAVLGV